MTTIEREPKLLFKLWLTQIEKKGRVIVSKNDLEHLSMHYFLERNNLVIAKFNERAGLAQIKKETNL